AAVFRAVRRRLTHSLRGVAHLLRRLREFGPLLFARQLLETTRRLLELVGEFTLALPATAAFRLLLLVRGRAALPFEFLLLAPRQVLQLLGELVDLPIVALLIGALLQLVLVRQLVELELEQIGEVLGELAVAATAATASALANLHLVAFLRILQQLQ